MIKIVNFAYIDYPHEHFMGEAQDALKLIASHGLMPPRQTYKKNVFINYIQDYPIEKRFRCVIGMDYGNSFVTTNRTYGKIKTMNNCYSIARMKDPYSTMGTQRGYGKIKPID